jgi:peptidoglycan-associated lipoprotein
MTRALRRAWRALSVLGIAAALAACPKPPTDLLKKAKETLDKMELAKKCAPELYRSALKLYQDAEELNKKKAYKEAARAAEEALKLAEKAQKQAEANKADCEKIAAADQMGKTPPEGSPGAGGAPPASGEKPAELPGAGGAPPEGPVLQTVTVYFDFNKYDVRPEAAQTLSTFAATVKGNAAAQIEVEGHCDARGSVEYNLSLGERRAKAVRDFLIAQGLPERSISIISYGAERPAVDGATEEAYAKNRRAVVNRR